MNNPDRAEFGLQSTDIPENPKKNGHLPRWLRVPAFTARMLLATLTATPGMVIAADVINQIANPAIVYADAPIGRVLGIAQRKECWWEINLEVTGLRPGSHVWQQDNKSDLVVCSTGERTGIPYQGAIDFGTADTSGRILINHLSPYYGTYHYIVWDDAGHRVQIDFTYTRFQIPVDTPTPRPSPTRTSIPRPTFTPELTKTPTSIPTRTMTPTPSSTSTPEPTRTAVTVMQLTQTPESVIQPGSPSSSTSPEKDSDLPKWLLGLGSFFLAGFAVNEFYRRWRLRRSAGTTGGAGGSTGSTVPPIGGPVGALGGPSNPNTSPSTGPAQPKPPDPEWVTGQQEFERRWQAAKSKLSPVRPGETGNEYEYILERFKATMNIVHEMSLDNSAIIQVPKMAVRIRAGMEYVIPEVWPDNSILRRFFDPRFNAGYFTSEDFAKMVYLPEMYRSLSKFNKAQRSDVRRIHRILVHALHPDTSKNEADPKVQDSVDDLLKRFNPAWPYIENLIKLTP